MTSLGVPAFRRKSRRTLNNTLPSACLTYDLEPILTVGQYSAASYRLAFLAGDLL
ncbi:hypothetical protein J6TS1_16240 [Siminovitchia terrae]|uniref:Uncharacterized protein n=1 Tax=Siminovitchia terrae TaxID=1914933 RepID=A0ABQ4KVR6_SIMTE|nr:hypothetical protein [Siminovitchia terrae]GIN91663.1 hypothetical protein J22TS1_27140 [Siminovitchia terrae]GIN95754.1 hypothetical protein J6TS1_16240 [Siminovitchia terrae]